jgi:putrescine aminotransferase
VEIVAKPGTNQRFGDAPGKAGPIVRDLCINNGLMIRAVRDTVVMSPPLTISRDQIDRMVGIIRKSLDEAAPVLRERYPQAVSAAA